MPRLIWWWLVVNGCFPWFSSEKAVSFGVGLVLKRLKHWSRDWVIGDVEHCQDQHDSNGE